MLEVLFIVVLSVFAVVAAVAGVGMANEKEGKREKKKPSLVKTMESLQEKIEKGIEKGQGAVKKVNENPAVSAAVGSYVLLDRLYGAITKETQGTGARTMELLRALTEGSDAYKRPVAYLGAPGKFAYSFAYGDISEELEKRLGWGGSENDARKYLLDYASGHGLDPKKIHISFREDLNNYTNRGESKSEGGMDYIGIAKYLDYYEKLETGEHEINHLTGDYDEATINAMLFKERMKKPSKNYGLIMAQGNYIHELSKSVDAEKRKIAEGFKEISPEGKRMLEDPLWQKIFENYRKERRIGA